MMHDRAVRWLGAVISSLVCGAFVACAGSDTPPVNDSLEAAITQNFGDRAVAAGGAGGASTAGRGGSSARPPAAPDDGDPQPLARGGSAGTATEDEPPAGDDPPPSSGACDGFAVLSTSCNGSACHGDGSSFGDFAASEDVALSFVDVDASATCSGEGPLIDPANPRQSVIIQKVLGTASCGSPMPLTGPLEEADIDCLEEWIGSL